MPACARSEIVREGEAGVYHVYNRCVRRAFLCGEDSYSGKNYDYRRDWIGAFERRLAGLFGVDVGFHGELSNHLHLMLRTRPDIVELWTDQDVARRWLIISRLIHSGDGESVRPVTNEEIKAELAKPDRAAELRKRLASVSQFMKALCEHIARRANREDETSGAFFESRFKCKDLANDAAILLCGVYVDLNQIRAGEASTPEESTHTSAGDRIAALLLRNEALQFGSAAWQTESRTPDDWLCELTVDGRACAYRGADPSRTGRRASDKGLLPIRLEEYLQLLDWTGRMLVEDPESEEGTKGAIPHDLAPILERLGINRTKWLELVSRFEQLFSHVVGTAEQLAQRATAAGRRWYRGRHVCAEAFG